MLKVGDPAPSFELATDAGKTVRSADLKGQRYVLFFYPKDNTPTCTTEVCAFRDAQPALRKLAVPVFGVSGDSVVAHGNFVRKYALNFPLLADTDLQLVKAYGLWVEKSLYGRKYFGIQRSTFAIGADGRVAQVWEKVKAETHAEEVRAWLAGGAAPAKKAVAKKAVAKKGKR